MGVKLNWRLLGQISLALTEVPGRTQDVLFRHLLEGLSVAQVLAVYPRLAVLCGEIGTGFFTQVQRTLLVEQENMREALSATLALTERRFQAIFEEAAIGIALLDMEERRVVMSNPALVRMLGYETDDLYKLRFNALTHPDDVAASALLDKELVARRRDHYQVEKRYIRKDGHVMWGRLTVSLVQDARGGTLFSIGMVEDVTAHKLMEADLTQAQRQLRRSREEERLHLARELHDGPIQDLLGASLHLEILREWVQNAAGLAQVTMVQEIQEQVGKTLRAICHDLRPPALTPFGLEAEIRLHVAHFEETCPEVEVRAELTPDGQTLPEGVRLALFRIYQEAMSNIVRHADARHVLVRFVIDAEQAFLEIEDDGRGFAVPAPLSALIQQGRLGLLGAAERAEAIGGCLEVVPGHGRGTIVRVSVPHSPQDGEIE